MNKRIDMVKLRETLWGINASAIHNYLSDEACAWFMDLVNSERKRTLDDLESETNFVVRHEVEKRLEIDRRIGRPIDRELTTHYLISEKMAKLEEAGTFFDNAFFILMCFLDDETDARKFLQPWFLNREEFLF